MLIRAGHTQREVRSSAAGRDNIQAAPHRVKQPRRGVTDTDVIMILPETQPGRTELQKTLARFHAEHACKMIEKMPCPTEQKLELINAVLDDIKAEKKAAKA